MKKSVVKDVFFSSSSSSMHKIFKALTMENHYLHLELIAVVYTF